ncbi:endolytic transglycosylase MltG [Saccharomonospora sp. NPDC006951]
MSTPYEGSGGRRRLRPAQPPSEQPPRAPRGEPREPHQRAADRPQARRSRHSAPDPDAGIRREVDPYDHDQDPPARGVPSRPPGAQGRPPRARRMEGAGEPPARPVRHTPRAAEPPREPEPERSPRPPRRRDPSEDRRLRAEDRGGTRPRRRRSPNEGVPADENPTEILDLGYDDLLDEDVTDDEYYDDERDDRAVPEYFDDERDEPPEDPPKPKRGKRFLGWLVALTVIVVLAGGAYWGARELFGFGAEDYAGTGERDVLIEIEEGDSTRAIAARLHDLDVVASAAAFVNASEDDSRILGVQPGYYVVKTKMSGANAVAKLVEPGARVGELQLRAGTQLDDLTQPDGKVTPGVFSLLSNASCAELNGDDTCIPADELRKVVEETDLTELGVPEWAAADAAKAEPKRRLEGIIQPGVYDVKPGWDAKQLLQEVLKTSATRMQAAGLPDAAGQTDYSPYQILIIASLIEREAVEADFGKVARVIYNRNDIDMRLEFDSTVNYVLDRPEVRTNAEDRERAGAYNTYKNTGLPPTPISAPSMEAIKAAEKPATGDYLFFVKCEKNGLSCFSNNLEEHERNAADSRKRGVY